MKTISPKTLVAIKPAVLSVDGRSSPGVYSCPCCAATDPEGVDLELNVAWIVDESNNIADVDNARFFVTPKPALGLTYEVYLADGTIIQQGAFDPDNYPAISVAGYCENIYLRIKQGEMLVSNEAFAPTPCASWPEPNWVVGFSQSGTVKTPISFSGVISDPTAQVSIFIADDPYFIDWGEYNYTPDFVFTEYPAVNNGDGTWTCTINEYRPIGGYGYFVVATDQYGRSKQTQNPVTPHLVSQYQGGWVFLHSHVFHRYSYNGGVFEAEKVEYAITIAGDRNVVNILRDGENVTGSFDSIMPQFQAAMQASGNDLDYVVQNDGIIRTRFRNKSNAELEIKLEVKIEVKYLGHYDQDTGAWIPPTTEWEEILLDGLWFKKSNITDGWYDIDFIVVGDTVPDAVNASNKVKIILPPES